MSRLTGNDAKGLMEAYSAVYAPQEEVELTEEQVWEEVENWVNSLLEEGYDLSEYTWGEMYEEYLKEYGENAGIGYANRPGTAAQLQQRSRNIQARGGWLGQAYRALNRSLGAKEPSWDKADRDDRRREQTALRRASNPNWKPTGGGGDGAGTPPPPDPDGDKGETPPPPPNVVSAKNIAGQQQKVTVGRQYAAKLGGKDVKVTYDASGKRTVSEPTSSAAPPASTTPPPTEAPKPAAGQTGDKTKDMATWAKANPKLAAAAAERARTRGTSATTNPQMDGLKSRLPAPQPPAPPSTPSSTSAPTPTAAAPKPTPAAPKPNLQQTIRANRGLPTIRSSYEYEDAYDLVLEYLLSQGHADTVEEANYVMLEMDSETIQSICEAQAVPMPTAKPPSRSVPMPAPRSTNPNERRGGAMRFVGGPGPARGAMRFVGGTGPGGGAIR